MYQGKYYKAVLQKQGSDTCNIQIKVYPEEFLTIIGSEYETIPEENEEDIVVVEPDRLSRFETVEDNIASGFFKRFRKKDEKILISRACQNIMAQLRLEGIAKKRVGKVTEEQKIWISIARAMLQEPEVLVLNNTLSSFDVKKRGEMIYELRKIQKKLDVSIVYTTDDDWEALRISDRIIVMNQEKIEQIGTPEEIYHAPVSRYTAAMIENHNIFEGYIEKIEGNKAYIIAEAGKIIAPAEDFQEDEMMYLSIRPEKIKISKEKISDIEIPGVIVEYKFAGPYYETKVMLLNGHEIIVYTPDKSLKPGTSVYISWDEKDAAMIHTAGESVYDMIEKLSIKVGNSLKISV